jgi:hypothetical protein
LATLLTLFMRGSRRKFVGESLAAGNEAPHFICGVQFDRYSLSAISQDSALSEASISGFSWNHFVMVLAMIARGNNLFYMVIQPFCSAYY